MTILNMTGQQLTEYISKNKIKTKICYDENEKIFLEAKTARDDTLIFKTPRMTIKHLGVLQECLFDLQCDYAKFPDQRLFYIPPQAYWALYKSGSYWCDFIKKSTSFLVNGTPYHFPTPDFYFNTEKMENIQFSRATLGGIYGIYYQEELLYIGSSVNLISRWCEHNQAFLKHDIYQNEMYGNPDINAAEVEYKMLVSSLDIAKGCGLENQSTWLLEFAEWMLIATLKPKYNRAGKKSMFRFHSKVHQGKEVKKFLEDDRYQVIQGDSSLPESVTTKPTQSQPQLSTQPQQKQETIPTEPAPEPEPLPPAREHPSDLPSYFLSQDDEALLLLPTIKLPERTFSINGSILTAQKTILFNQDKSHFLVSEDTPPETIVNVIDPEILYQPEDSPYHLTDWAFAYWQNYCERSAAKQSTTFIEAMLDSRTKQELFDKGYLGLSQDNPKHCVLIRSYIKQQLPLKEVNNDNT